MCALGEPVWSHVEALYGGAHQAVAEAPDNAADGGDADPGEYDGCRRKNRCTATIDNPYRHSSEGSGEGADATNGARGAPGDGFQGGDEAGWGGSEHAELGSPGVGGDGGHSSYKAGVPE